MESEFEMEVRQFLARPPFGYRMVPTEALALFCAALTHDSYVNERGGESYERLEFLGDAVLELIACDRVYRDRVLAFGPDIDGIMRVGGGHRGPEGSVIEENMRADSFEAILGAVYLTYGLEEAKRVASETVLRDLPTDQ